MKRIYFVRHGLTRDNIADRVQNEGDPLSEEGVRQADTVAERLKHIPFEILYSSPYDRTQKTAEAIASVTGHAIVLDDDLHELPTPPQYHGMLRSDPVFLSRPQLAMEPSLEEYDALSGETFETTFTRADRFLKKIQAGKEDVVCAVTHGAFLQFLLLYTLTNGKPTVQQWATSWGAARIANTGITVLEYNVPRRPWRIPERWILINWNDDAHLG